MKWPQIVMILLLGWNIIDEFRKHGTPKEGFHNFWTTLIATVISVLILWFGGFFG